jgi:hypothetical protein
MADRGEVLAARHDVGLIDDGGGLGERVVEARRAPQRHPLGTFEEHEVPQRLLSKRHEGQADAGRIVLGRGRQVGAGEVRRGADRREQVLDQREVEHLVSRHVGDDLAPALHGRQLVLGQPLVGALLEREHGEQVLEHDPVLQLSGLVEHVDQRLAMLDHERRLGRRLAAARLDHLGEPAHQSDSRPNAPAGATGLGSGLGCLPCRTRRPQPARAAAPVPRAAWHGAPDVIET